MNSKITYGRNQSVAAGAVLLLLVAAAYFPVTWAGFIWDDDSYVLNNVLLRSWSGLSDIWFTRSTPQYYPAVFTTFWIEYQLYGLHPLGYHLVNVVLHFANALLLVRIARLLGLPAPWWIAALFALHPVHVESVAWITERKNVLSLLFYLLSFERFVLFVREPFFRELVSAAPASAGLASAGLASSGQGKRRRFYAGALVFFILALLSKSVTCSLPAVLVLFLISEKKLTWASLTDRSPDAQRTVWPLIPFFALGLLLGLHTALLEQTHVGATGSRYALTFPERCLVAAKALLFYIGKLLYPYPLIFNYEKWQIKGAPAAAYLPLGAVLLIIGCLVWTAFRKHVAVPLLAAFFTVSLFPALGFFNVYPFRYSFVADHFQYIASIGIIAAVVVCEHALLRRFCAEGKTFVWVYRTFVAVLLAALTYRQALAYENLRSLYQDTLAKNYCSALAHNNLGQLLLDSGELEQAMAHFNKTIQCDPEFMQAYQNRGNYYLRKNEFGRAIPELTKAIELGELHAELYHARGYAYFRSGRFREALADLNTTIRFNPREAQAHGVRGLVMHFGFQQSEEACGDWQTACKLGRCEFLKTYGPTVNCGASTAQP